MKRSIVVMISCLIVFALASCKSIEENARESVTKIILEDAATLSMYDSLGQVNLSIKEHKNDDDERYSPIINVWMDGKMIGCMSYENMFSLMIVPPGDHIFKITAKGYKTAEKAVYVIGLPQTQRIFFDLEKE